jgi:hypothetical protein
MFNFNNLLVYHILQHELIIKEYYKNQGSLGLMSITI